jgi:hypothetical protein
LWDIDGDDPKDILILILYSRSLWYFMNLSCISKAYDQAALTSRVMTVRFQNLPLHESCLDFCHIQIFLRPFLLGMDAKFVFPLSDQQLGKTARKARLILSASGGWSAPPL